MVRKASIFFGILTILAITASIYLNARKTKLLKKCSVNVEGTIIKLKKSRNKGYTATAKFLVNDSFQEAYYYVGRPHPYLLGDTVSIQYACEKPDWILINGKK